MNLSKLEIHVLEALDNKELSGLDIQKVLEKNKQFNSLWGIRSIHPTLWKLGRLGLIKSRPGKPLAVRNGMRRWYWSLTNQGKGLLTQAYTPSPLVYD